MKILKMINMRNMKGYVKALAAGFLLSSVACTNLEETVFSEVTADNFFNTPEEVAAGAGAIYTQWTFWFGEGWSLSEVSSDEVVVPTRGADWFDNGNWQRVHLHNNDAGDDRIQGSWNELFKPVNTANRLIAQFESALASGSGDPAIIEPAIAELKGMRALSYFYLLDLYGNVPLVTDFVVPEGFQPENGSGADMTQRRAVYDFLVGELTELRDSGLLKNDPDATDPAVRDAASYGQFNYWACQSLLAKLYLNEGVYRALTPTQGAYIPGNYAAAEAAIRDVLDNGGFATTGDYFDNFVTANDLSSEIIFALVYDEVFVGEFNLQQRTLHYGSQATFDLQQQPWNGYCTLEEFYNMFDKNPGAEIGADDEFVDRRGNMFIRGPQFTSTGQPITDDSFEEGKDLLPADNPAELYFDPVLNEFEPVALRQAGARIGKYEIRKGALQNLSNDYPVFRLGDLYLMLAEIQLERDGAVGDALPLINGLRARAGVAEYASLTDEAELLRERGRELAFEYWRRNDLIRYGRFNDEWWGKAANQNSYAGNTTLYGANAGVTNPDGVIVTAPAADAGLTPDRTVFPIPRSALQANSNLAQNPGYSE